MNGDKDDAAARLARSWLVLAGLVSACGSARLPDEVRAGQGRT